jgi:hypothetical protein
MPTSVLPALDLLAKVKDPVADDALLAAVPHLEGDALTATVDLLISRANTTALVHLLRCRHNQPKSLDPLLVGRTKALYPALSRALVESEVEDRLGAVSLIAAASDIRCADLLTEALRHACARTNEAATEALVVMSERVLSAPPQIADDVRQFRDDASRLGDAVCNALDAWDHHHQPGVLQLALRVISMTQAHLARVSEETGTPLSHALHRAIEKAADPRIAEAVVWALGIPRLRAAAAHAISRTQDTEFIGALLKSAWLVELPAVRHGCRAIRKADWSEEWLTALAALDASAVAAALSFVSATGGRVDAKVDLFRRLLADSSSAIRLAAFWQTIGAASETPALHMLQALATRSGEEIARLARLACFRSDHSAAPDQTVSATTACAPHALRRALRDPNPVERVRALALIEQTQSEGLFKEDILRLLRDEAPAVRSAAVSLLATLPVTNPSYLLRHSLNDTDARVQANAVEVADTLHLRDLSPLIAGQMGAPDARLRANAVKFCAQEGLHEAGEQLIAMLESPAAAHRRSAIWVVERLQLLSLQPRIERLAATDRDAAVKKAALRVVQRFALGKRKDSPAVNRSPSAALGA